MAMTFARGEAAPLASPWSAEAEFVFMLAGPAGLADAEVPERPLDWRWVVALAERERATHILRDYLQRVASPWPGLDARREIQRLAIVSEFRMQFLAQRLEALLAAFEAARIKTLLLKGAALACTVYPGFAQRPMSDVDLLVEPGRAEEAWRLALTLGWAPVYGDQVSPIYEGHHHLAPLRDATGIDVGLELHTGILPPAHPFKLEVGALWRDALFARVGRTPALVPSHLHRILHLCAHFAWSHALREGAWRTFRDIHAIVTHESPDWDSVVESARRTRMTTCCYWTFRLAGAASGVKVPDEVLRALSPRLPAFALRRLERYFLTMITPPPHWDQPTRRLRHLLWVAGIQPRLSGHGGVRPWSRNHLFAELVHGEGHEDAPEDDAPNPWIRRAQQLMREVAVLT